MPYHFDTVFYQVRASAPGNGPGGGGTQSFHSNSRRALLTHQELVCFIFPSCPTYLLAKVDKLYYCDHFGQLFSLSSVSEQLQARSCRGGSCRDLEREDAGEQDATSSQDNFAENAAAL